ncbi:MAG: mechanosensitive ion channel family protein [Acidobacteriota bacterium]
MEQAQTLLDSLERTWNVMVAFVPALLIAILLLSAGWLAAKVARRLVIRLFRQLRIDEMAERAGIDDFLVQGGVPFTTVTLLGSAIYWMILLGVFIAVLEGLGVTAAGDMLRRMFNYLPNLLLAVFVLVVGTLFSRILGGIVYTYLSNLGSEAAGPIAAVARYAVLVFVVFMAAEQLAVQSTILVSAFQIAFGAICLGLALAFGLGGREWAASILTRYTRR